MRFSKNDRCFYCSDRRDNSIVVFLFCFLDVLMSQALSVCGSQKFIGNFRSCLLTLGISVVQHNHREEHICSVTFSNVDLLSSNGKSD